MPLLDSLSRARRDGLLAPYLALLLSPLLLTAFGPGILNSRPDCGSDEPWWRFGDFELALLPALADFAPFLWLASGSGRVREAAVVAGLLGATRYAVVQGLTLLYHAASPGQEGNAGCTMSIYFAVSLMPVLLALWLGSALIAVVMMMRYRASNT